MALRAGGWVACALALTLATTSADANEAQVVAEKCGSDEDCSLNGVCQPATAICACDPAWGGPACATLNLLPVPGDPAATVAVAYPPPADFNTTTSWGGSVVKAEDGQYHLFAAEMAVRQNAIFDAFSRSFSSNAIPWAPHDVLYLVQMLIGC